MSKILVLAPMLVESNKFKDSLKNVKHKHDYHVSLIGVGKVNAASETAIQLASKTYDLVVLIGFAGATSDYSLGELVMPETTYYTDVHVPTSDMFQDLRKKYSLQGSDPVSILTADSFIVPEDFGRLKSTYNFKSALFDMESAAVAQVCESTNNPLLIMKTVSDTPFSEDYNEHQFNDFIESDVNFDMYVTFLENIL